MNSSQIVTPAKLCECGCGAPVGIATKTRKELGWIKGKPKRFISGHNTTPLGRRLRHGQARRNNIGREYKAYLSAKGRCNDKKSKNWVYYGGRGIRFLFTDFAQFLAELGPKPDPSMMLDRINNDGDYRPGNVRWATKSESNKNKRYHSFSRRAA